jgi:hypothetical protein
MNTADTTFYVPTEEERFSIVLEEASAASYHGIKMSDIMRVMTERVEDMQNPNKALEIELTNLVLNKTPPNGEIYNLRSDKSELAVPFFERVYGRFYEQGLIYRSDLRILDKNLLNLLGQYKGKIHIKTNEDRISERLRKI